VLWNRSLYRRFVHSHSDFPCGIFVIVGERNNCGDNETIGNFGAVVFPYRLYGVDDMMMRIGFRRKCSFGKNKKRGKEEKNIN